MGKVGLIGGMSPESTVIYYEIINKRVNERLGGLHSAKIIMESVDLEEIVSLQRQGDWGALETMMIDAARRLEAGGADCIVICTNTMHKTAPIVQDLISIPLIHIADATAQEIKKNGLSKVALLGTKITMKEDFYKKRLIDRHGIEAIIPSEAEMKLIDGIIFDELCLGKIDRNSRIIINRIIGGLADKGARGVVLGCTELPLLIDQMHLNEQLFDMKPIVLFNTTEIHAEAAANFALGN